MKIKDFFVAVDPTLDTEDKFSYARSRYPFLQCEEITISTNAAVIESPTEEVKTISIVSSIPQSNFNKHKRGSAMEWFNNPMALRAQRVRIIACIGEPNSYELDLISQRFNEYLQKKMPTSGPAGVQSFIKSFIGQKGPESYNLRMRRLLGDSGPFDLGYLKTVLESQKPAPTYYDRNSVLSNVIIYDAPFSEVLKLEDDGYPSVEYDNTIIAGAKDKTTNTKRVILKPIEIRVGFEQEYENINIDHLSIYAFVYNDIKSVVPEGFAIPAENKKNPMDKNIVLEVGSGFTSVCTPIGIRNIFAPQIEETPLALPSLSQAARLGTSPDKNKLEDLSNFDRIVVENINGLIYQTFYEELVSSSGVDKPAADIISADNFFSPLWITKCDNDYARYSFSFDVMGFLTQKSQYPWLYKKRKAVKAMLSENGLLEENETPRILSAKMRKRIVSPTAQVPNNRLGTMLRTKIINPSYTHPEIFVANPTRIESVFLEQDTENTGDIAFFQGYDSYKDDKLVQNITTYQYGAVFDVLDPAELFIRRHAKSLRDVQSKINSFYEFLVNSPPVSTEGGPPPVPVLDGAGLYNRNTGLRQVSLGGIQYGQVMSNQFLEAQIDTYISSLQIFTSISISTADQVKEMLNSMVNSREVLGIRKVADFVNNLATSLEKVLKNSFPIDPYGEGTTEQFDLQRRHHSKINIIHAETYFDELFDFGKKYNTGYNYMSDNEEGNIPNPEGMPTFSKDFLDARAKEEFNKYFGNYVAEGSPGTLLENIFPGYAESSYQYFTPKTIKIYGEEKINQPSYKNPESNVATYDLDRYGELFYNIISMNRQTKYLNHPFYELSVPGIASPRQLEESVLQELKEHGCYLRESRANVIQPPQKLNTVSKTKKTKGLQDASGNEPVGLFEFAFGGGELDVGDYNTFLNKASSPYSPTATGSFGVKNLEKGNNAGAIDQLKMENASKPAIKLLFNILGELELRPSANLLSSYEKASFNSSLADNKKIGITAQNVKSMIEGPLSSYPNQLKSLYVSAASQEQLLLGNGFDAIRVELEDQDPGVESSTISTIMPGQNFPPYASVRDPMKVYSKFLAFWMNYKQIAVLEYLAGFESMDTSNISDDFNDVDIETEIFLSKVKLPIWKKFDLESYESNRKRSYLCRWRNFSPSDLGTGNTKYIPNVSSKDIFDLPIYNNYFLLRG